MKWVLLFVVVFLLCNASAFSVSSFYHSSVPLTGEIGEIREVIFYLSNSQDRDIEVEASFIEGQDIAEFVQGNRYVVAPGERVEVPVSVVISEDSREVSVLFDSSFIGGDDTVSFSPSYITGFDVFSGELAGSVPGGIPDVVDVSGEEDKEQRDVGQAFVWMLYSVLSLAILIVLITIVVISRRRRIEPSSHGVSYNLQ